MQYLQYFYVILLYITFRIAENTTEIHRLRPPRRFHKDHIMRPYNMQEAEGCAILMVKMIIARRANIF